MIEAAKSKYNILFNPGKENGGRFQPLLNEDKKVSFVGKKIV